MHFKSCNMISKRNYNKPEPKFNHAVTIISLLTSTYNKYYHLYNKDANLK